MRRLFRSRLCKGRGGWRCLVYLLLLGAISVLGVLQYSLLHPPPKIPLVHERPNSPAFNTCVAQMLRPEKPYIRRRYKYQPVVIHDAMLTADETIKCSLPCRFKNHGISADASFTSTEMSPWSVYSSARQNFDLASLDPSKTIKMNHQLDSDVPIGPWTWELPWTVPARTKQPQQRIICSFNSYCRPGDLWYKIIHEMILAKLLDSFGQCFQTEFLPRESDFVEIMQSYKFSLIIPENKRDSIYPNFFRALAAASVPVIVGDALDPNITNYLPKKRNDAFLFISDENQIPTLIERMKTMAANTSAFDDLFSWKVAGASDTFKALLDLTIVNPECRLCIHVAARQEQKRRISFFEENPDSQKQCVCEAYDYLGGVQRRKVTVYRFSVRERGTWDFLDGFLESKDLTAAGLQQVVLRLFTDAGHTPIWSRIAGQSWRQTPTAKAGEGEGPAAPAPLRIWKIYPVLEHQESVLFGQAALNSDAKVTNLFTNVICPDLEVIFI